MSEKRKPTSTPGVRYREHSTRKHGIKKDRYFFIRFKVDGKGKEEGLGWASEGMTETKAALERGKLLENQRLGKGHKTLKEARKVDEGRRVAKREEAEREIKEQITFEDMFLNNYLPLSKDTKKRERSWQIEESLFRLWLAPVIGNKPLKDIAPIHLQKITTTMMKAGRSWRTAHYAMATVRRVFNHAISNDLYAGVSPITKIKMPSGDNNRLRFLTQEEAATLLAEIATKSTDVHDVALISMQTGARAGEIFSLTHGDVDTTKGLLTLRDTKNGKTRTAFMTEAVKEILSRKQGSPSDLVFPGREGVQSSQISKTFNRAVDALGLNEGVTDRRMKVVFHTLRHSYASWHVENGTDLFTVSKLLGHSDFKMTQRYAHLGESTLQAAVKKLDKALTKKPGKLLPLVRKG